MGRWVCPGLPGKQIGNPLTRLYGGYYADGRNQKRVGANRCYAKAWGCDPYFPRWSEPIDPNKPPNGGTLNECDEYPFASTYRGAARWQTDGNQYKNMFSARSVVWWENRKAGEVLLAWYNWDRIPERGEYFIKVE